MQTLEPAAGLDLMAADGVEDVVVEGEEVAGDGVVGADVGAGAGDLRRAVGGGGAGDDDGADGLARQEGAARGGDVSGDGAEEEEAGAREAEARGVEQAGGEDVLLLDARDLLAEGFVDERERVLGGGVRGRVVGGVDGEEEVVGGEVGVEAGGAEVLADVLRGVGVGERDAGGLAFGVVELGAVGDGPEIEKGGRRR